MVGPPSSPRGARRTRMAPVQNGALVVGVVFLLVGVLGFVPGITTGYDGMTFAGHESEAMLFDVFQVSVLHNLVHLAFGIVGLAAAAKSVASMWFLIVGGVAYLALWIYGLAIDHGTEWNFLPVNTAIDWLHFGLGVGMIVLGLVLPKSLPSGPAPGGEGMKP